MAPSKSLKIPPNVESSVAESEKVEFNWIIRDFMTQYAVIKSTGQTNKISEVEFNLKNSSWNFYLRQSGEEDVGIYLYWASLDKNVYCYQVTARFEAKLKWGQVNVLPHTLFERPMQTAASKNEHGIEKFTTLSQLGGFGLPGGNLEIGLKASFHQIKTTSAKVPSWNELLVNVLNCDLGKILESGELSDVTLVLNEELQPQQGKAPTLIELKVHKTILGARSPVFAAMFENDMKEKSSNRVVIEEVSAKAMKVLLKIIYTGDVAQCQEWGEVVDELIYASDKYQLASLKSFLDVNISAVFTPQNVLKLRKTLQLHELAVGVQAAEKYAKDNFSRVLDSN